MLESVKETIGVEFESILFDNRETRWGLCRVYNHCAEKAGYRFLCFIHEDTLLRTNGWGKILIDFMESTTNCGVIGFAGGTIAERNFFSWGGFNRNGRCRIYDPQGDGKDAGTAEGLVLHYCNPDNERFSKVIAVDGAFLFVGYEVWRQNKFDEKDFQGYHFYDADFSFGIAQGRQNYACLCADFYHYSAGPRDKNFYLNARIFQKKWKTHLPMVIGDKRVRITDELDRAFTVFKLSRRSGLSLASCVSHLVSINGPLFGFLMVIYAVYRICKKLLTGLHIRRYRGSK